VTDKSSEDRERDRVKTTVQRRFSVQPGSEAIVSPFSYKIAGYTLIRCAVHSESETNTVFVERIWQSAKMSDKKNRDCEGDMKRSSNEQISTGRRGHQESSLQDLQDLTGFTR
jgi:hypothetical protein